jgi:hypothetical protein
VAAASAARRDDHQEDDVTDQATTGTVLRAFGAGMLAVNAVPHGVSGVQGRPFPSPFGTPSGVGESSPVSNVAWSAINAWGAAALAVGTSRVPAARVAFGLGATVGAALVAGYFGRLRGAVERPGG